MSRDDGSIKGRSGSLGIFGGDMKEDIIHQFPNSIEMLNQIIDERVERKFKEMMTKSMHAGRRL